MVKIRAYIGEATEYDKKETLEERRPKSWLKSVSAFANGNGGVLLFGIADDDALKGLPDVKTASEKISEAVKSKMDPIPSIELQIRQEEGKDFILLHVAQGLKRHTTILEMAGVSPISVWAMRAYRPQPPT